MKEDNIEDEMDVASEGPAGGSGESKVLDLGRIEFDEDSGGDLAVLPGASRGERATNEW